MRLITPKRLKENEEFMWRLADRQIDEFIERGECEFISEYGGPFAMLVVADLLGVPGGRPRDCSANGSAPVAQRTGTVGGTGTATSLAAQPARVPLRAVHRLHRGSPPRTRATTCMTGLATATFPDGSTPDVIDVVRIAANLFAAGQETTVRLLGTALQCMGERPDLQAAAARRPRARSRTSSKRRCASRARSRATSGCRA